MMQRGVFSRPATSFKFFQTSVVFHRGMAVQHKAESHQSLVQSDASDFTPQLLPSNQVRSGTPTHWGLYSAPTFWSSHLVPGGNLLCVYQGGVVDYQTPFTSMNVSKRSFCSSLWLPICLPILPPSACHTSASLSTRYHLEWVNVLIFLNLACISSLFKVYAYLYFPKCSSTHSVFLSDTHPSPCLVSPTHTHTQDGVQSVPNHTLLRQQRGNTSERQRWRGREWKEAEQRDQRRR